MKKRYLLLLLLLTFSSFSQTAKLKKVLEKVYAFEKDENFNDAKTVFLSFLSDKSNMSSEVRFVNNYLILYDYLITEKGTIQNFDIVINSLLAVKKRKYYETELLLNLYTQKYFLVAENDGWESALEVAQKGYELKDFNQTKLITKTDYLYDMGFLYDKAGNSFEGIKFYKKSLAVYIKQYGEINKEVALNYNNLAFAYSNVYNQKKTIDYYNKAALIWQQTIKKEDDTKDYLITAYHNLISQYLSYGDLEKAQECGKKLNDYFESKYSKAAPVNATSYPSYVLSNIRLFLASKQFVSAKNKLETYENQVNTAKNQTEDFKYLLQSYNEIIDYCIENNQCEEGEILTKKALNIAEKLKFEHYLVVLNAKLAASNMCLNKYELALKYINLSQQYNTSTSFNSSKYTLELQKAIVSEKLQKKTVIKTVKTNLEGLVFDLTKKKKDIRKIKFSDVEELVSPDFIKLFYKSGRLYFNQFKLSKNKIDLQLADQLYKISSKLFKEYYLKGEYNNELNQYNSEITEGLLEIAIEKKLGNLEKIDLINDIERNASQHLAKEFFKKIKLTDNKANKAVVEIKELKTELNFYQNQQKTSKTEQKIKLIEEKISMLLAQTSNFNQEIEKNSVEKFDINMVQKAIADEEILIKFYTLTNQVFRVEVTSKSIEIVKVGAIDQVKTAVTFLLKNTKTISPNYLSYSKNLTSLLRLDKKHKKVTIIPDGFLNYLPFETLYDAKNKQFLVQNYLISYAYSLPIWLVTKQNNITVNNDKLVAFSPRYSTAQVSEVRSGMADLKYAKEEATRICKLFSGSNFLNEKATKEQFFKSMNSFGLFHFSMHSLLYENDFNKSCLLFSNNQKLYFSELYGLNFPAQMVVLSACDTGNGSLKSGEGIMSLSRALTYAGVKSSVYSLWQVPDKETSEIMISFYENLKKGQAKDEALANAKNTFIENNPMKNHPFYWAGFVVNGDVSPIVSGTNWLLFLAIGLSVIVLLFVFRKKLIQIFH